MRILFVFLVLVVLSAATVSIAKAEESQLCVQLKWLHQSQFAGFYVANETGLYRDKGLAIIFIEGGPKTNWIERMKDRSCPIGIANPHDLVVAREQGIPVVAVAVVDQVSPIVFFSLQERGIRNPRQFPGKSIALLGNALLQFYGTLKRVGVEPDTVVRAPFSVDMARLYKGEVDIWSGYHTNLVSKAEAEGYSVHVIHPMDYGVQVYDDIIYVREELIREEPDTVRNFLSASLEGWMRAIKHPAKAVEHTLKYATKSSRSHEEMLFRRTIPYVHTGEVPIGWMKLSVWEDIVRLTRDVGLITHEVNPETVFETRFLVDIYGKDAQ